MYKRPKCFPLKFPCNLEKIVQSIENIKLLENGLAVASYREIGTLFVSSSPYTAVKFISNDFKAVCFASKYPFLVSLHENNVLQFYHLDDGRTARHQLKNPLIRQTKCIMIDGVKHRLFCIGTERVFIIHYGSEVLNMPKEGRRKVSLGKRSSTPLDIEAEVLPIDEINLDYSKETGKKNLNIKEEFTFLITSSRLLIGGIDVFQVWDLIQTEERVTGSLLFQGASEPGVFFLRIVYFSSTIVTASQKSLLIWNIGNDVSNNRINPNRTVVPLRDNTIITAVFLDHTFLITGDNRGLIIVRERTNGFTLFALNSLPPVPNEQPLSFVVNLPTVSPSSSLLNMDLEMKITSIERVGRWVFCVSRDTIKIYDMNAKEQTVPYSEYTTPQNRTIFKLLIEEGTLYIGLRGQNENEKCFIVIWNPDLEGFAFMSLFKMRHVTLPPNIITTIQLISYTHNRLVNQLTDIGIAKKENVHDLIQSITRIQPIIDLILESTSIGIPAEGLQQLLQSLQNYEQIVNDLASTGKLMRYLQSTRLRKNLDIQKALLDERIDALTKLLLANVTEEKKKKFQRNPSRKVLVKKETNKSLVPIMPSSHLPPQGLRNSAFLMSTNLTPQPVLAQDDEIPPPPPDDEVPPPPPDDEVPPPPSEEEYYEEEYYEEYNEEEEGDSWQVEEENGKVTITRPASRSISEEQVPQTLPVEWQPKPLYQSHPNSRASIRLVSGGSNVSETKSEIVRIAWSQFWEIIKKYSNSKPSPEDEQLFRFVLDNSNTGFVYTHTLQEFLRSFGPIQNSYTNVKNMFSVAGFHGYLSRKETELFLLHEADGTYIIRFAQSTPGAFAIGVKTQNKIHHILIQSKWPGFTVFENAIKQDRKFRTILEIVQAYPSILKIPFISTLPMASYFQGDMSTEEAEECLVGEPPGSFMIRFSGDGHYCASFVARTHPILRHLKIEKRGPSLYVVQDTWLEKGNFNETQFKSVEHLANYFIATTLFMRPCQGISSIFTKNRILHTNSESEK